MNRVRGLYRIVAPAYDLASAVWQRGYRDAYCRLEDWLASGFPAGARVLDLGCGTGANLELLRRLGLEFASYLGVDQSSAMLGRARRKFGQLANVRFQLLDLQVDPLPDGPFELIVSTWVLEHLEAPAQTVRSAWEILADDGELLLLFEQRFRGWQATVLGPIWRYFNVRLVSDEIAMSFPGIQNIERFNGLGPTIAIMRLARRRGMDLSTTQDLRRWPR